MKLFQKSWLFTNLSLVGQNAIGSPIISAADVFFCWLIVGFKIPTPKITQENTPIFGAFTDYTTESSTEFHVYKADTKKYRTWGVEK